ncbi:MAG: hypothetical protein AAGB31_01990 [Bdellovibrio sp.]
MNLFDGSEENFQRDRIAMREHSVKRLPSGPYLFSKVLLSFIFWGIGDVGSNKICNSSNITLPHITRHLIQDK